LSTNLIYKAKHVLKKKRLTNYRTAMIFACRSKCCHWLDYYFFIQTFRCTYLSHPLGYPV